MFSSSYTSSLYYKELTKDYGDKNVTTKFSYRFFILEIEINIIDKLINYIVTSCLYLFFCQANIIDAIQS